MEKFKEHAVWRRSDEDLDLALGLLIRLALANRYSTPRLPTF